MKPCDCNSENDTNKLNEQGLKINDYSIEVKPSLVILELGTRTTVRIPMYLFRRFAEWYLENQEKETKQ